MSPVRKHLVIHGTVQGVGYRWSMARAAEALGVRGWVRNRRDGTVEAVVQGDEELVLRLVAWCRRGPPGASVTGVAADPQVVDVALDGFSSRPTA
jgi:acylphosphatase